MTRRILNRNFMMMLCRCPKSSILTAVVWRKIIWELLRTRRDVIFEAFCLLSGGVSLKLRFNLVTTEKKLSLYKRLFVVSVNCLTGEENGKAKDKVYCSRHSIIFYSLFLDVKVESFYEAIKTTREESIERICWDNLLVKPIEWEF